MIEPKIMIDIITCVLLVCFLIWNLISILKESFKKYNRFFFKIIIIDIIKSILKTIFEMLPIILLYLMHKNFFDIDLLYKFKVLIEIVIILVFFVIFAYRGQTRSEKYADITAAILYYIFVIHNDSAYILMIQ